MNQKYSSREVLLADCPNCRQPYPGAAEICIGEKKRGLTDLQELQAGDICRGTEEETAYCLMRRNE